MKINFNTLYGVLLVILFCACANYENKKPIILHWYITEGVTLTDSIIIFDLFGDTVAIAAFSDGRVTMDNIEEGYYKFEYTDDNYNILYYTLYFIPGQNLSMHIDASLVTKERPLSKYKDKVEFSGDLSTINEYLVEVDDIWEEDFWGDKSKNIYAALEVSSQARSAHELLFANLSNHNMGKFKERELRSISYRYYYQLNHKKANYQRYRKEPQGIIPAFADNGFPESTDEYNIVNGEDYKVLGYIDLADRIVENKCKYKRLDVKESRGLYAMKLLDKFHDGKLKDILNKKYYQLYCYPIVPDQGEIDHMYNLAMANNSDPSYVNDLGKIYEDAKKLLPGLLAPSFNLPDHHGNMVSSDDLKGKYVYIDIWAVSCSPCIREFPYLTKLEEDYADAKIHFVSITLDEAKRKDKWIKMINDKSLVGIHLMADQKFRDDKKNLYQVSSIPHYILIDPEQKIVSAKALYPSDPAIRELFDELLSNHI